MSKRLPKSPDKKSAKKVPKTEGRPDEANSGKMFTLSNAKKKYYKQNTLVYILYIGIFEFKPEF